MHHKNEFLWFVWFQNVRIFCIFILSSFLFHFITTGRFCISTQIYHLKKKEPALLFAKFSDPRSKHTLTKPYPSRQKLGLTRRSEAGSTHRDPRQLTKSAVSFSHSFSKRLFPLKKPSCQSRLMKKASICNQLDERPLKIRQWDWRGGKERTIHGLMSPSRKWQHQGEEPGVDESREWPTAALLQIAGSNKTSTSHRGKKSWTA